uniref:translation initiation factor IF-2-like n=1 Tax=Agelaius phoeniceus TaxID=39638 RepID=UPI0023EC962B|nr:translation initiation factor IF-2-like [Agelaius phoeniceus]
MALCGSRCKREQCTHLAAQPALLRPPLRPSHSSCPRARRKAIGSGLGEVGTYALLLAPGHPPRSPSPPNNGSSVPAGSSALKSDRIPLRSDRRSRRPSAPLPSPAPVPAAGGDGRGGEGRGRLSPHLAAVTSPRRPPPARALTPAALPAPSPPADPAAAPAAGTRGGREREEERQAPRSGTSAAPFSPPPRNTPPSCSCPRGRRGRRGHGGKRLRGVLSPFPPSQPPAAAPRAGADKGEGSNTWRAPVPLWGSRVPQPRRRWGAGAGPSRPP